MQLLRCRDARWPSGRHLGQRPECTCLFFSFKLKNSICRFCNMTFDHACNMILVG